MTISFHRYFKMYALSYEKKHTNTYMIMQKFNSLIGFVVC